MRLQLLVSHHFYLVLERYRSAMEKMAEDMVRLRARTATLEAENYRLHGDLSLHRDLGHQLLDDANIDVMTKAEIADRIGGGMLPPHTPPLPQNQRHNIYYNILVLKMSLGPIRWLTLHY